MLALSATLTDLPFRGSRNYLHSTDLYPALNEFVKKQFSPRAFVDHLILRRVATHQVGVDFDNPDGAFGSFCIRNGRDQTKGWLVETDEPISSRIPFDEGAAALSVVHGPGRASFQKLLPQYSAFELLIILTKIVSSRIGRDHWWFCQIELLSPLLETAPLKCTLDRLIANRYLTFRIDQAGEALGSVTAVASTFNTSRSAL